MRILRLLIGIAATVSVIYFATTVPLGEKTLWQHLRAVSQTKESAALVKGVKSKAQSWLPRALQPAAEESPQDAATPENRAKLRHLIRDRLARAEGSAKDLSVHKAGTKRSISEPE